MNVHNQDDIRRKAEIDRLMSLANLQRLRGEFIPAEDSCKGVLELDPDNLQAQELQADLLYDRGKLDDAVQAYKEILAKDPRRISVEQKYARTVLEIGEREHLKFVTQDMIDNPEKYARPERSSGISILLSAVAPGFGHIYIGSYVKGLIILLSFVFSWIIVAFAPGTDIFAKQVGDYVRNPRLGINYDFLNPLAILFMGVGVFTYIYALIDAAVLAGKSGSEMK